MTGQRRPGLQAGALDGEERADRAAGAVLRALLEVMEANLEGAIADLDTEYLHDFRVSVRRSRAVQRELARIFQPGPLSHFRQEFRWLQRTTGQARDLDVHLAQFGALESVVPADLRTDLARLLEDLRDRREEAHREMVEALRSERTVALLAGWHDFLDGVGRGKAKGRPEASRPIGELAGQRIRHVYRKTVRMGLRIAPGAPAERYHELRKQGKELRYLLELFGLALYPTGLVKPLIKTLKGVQDVLGSHQDCEVQEATLRQLAGPDSGDGQPAEPVLVRLLIARLEGEKLASRAAFPERFAPLAAPQQRQFVKQVFR